MIQKLFLKQMDRLQFHLYVFVTELARYLIALRSASDHACLNGIIFSVKICHQPIIRLHFRHLSSILESLIINLIDLKLIIR